MKEGRERERESKGGVRERGERGGRKRGEGGREWRVKPLPQPSMKRLTNICFFVAH